MPLVVENILRPRFVQPMSSLRPDIIGSQRNPVMNFLLPVQKSGKQTPNFCAIFQAQETVTTILVQSNVVHDWIGSHLAGSFPFFHYQ